MKNQLKTIGASLCVVALVAGCAAPQPVPFQLIDSASAVQRGTIFPDRQQIEMTIDGQQYRGFYLVATGTGYSESYGGWRRGPTQSVTTYSSNSARAHLVSDKGQRLSCEFLLDGMQAIGECKTPAGVVYQLTAPGN
jgi:hypothetical protein